VVPLWLGKHKALIPMQYTFPIPRKQQSDLYNY